MASSGDYSNSNFFTAHNPSIKTIDDLRAMLTLKNDDGTLQYHINFKENDNFFMLYYNDLIENGDRDPNIVQFENNCRSVIIDKKTMTPVCSQYNRILYNDDAEQFLKDKDWSQVTIQKCHEGTYIILFFDQYENEWRVTTRRCLDAKESQWIKGKSYYTMFLEAIESKFSLDELDKNLCYHFVLLHHLNKNIVHYKDYVERDYKDVYHVLTTEKGTLNQVDVRINDNVKFSEEERNFKNLNDLVKALNSIDQNNRQTHQVTTEGFVLRYYHGEPGKSNFTVLKFQTPIYQYIMKIKPNNSNIHQNYLELYQLNRLNMFLPYFTKYPKDVINRINVSMKTISGEVLDLYHLTRTNKETGEKKNPELYNVLTDTYKRILFFLHGIFINRYKTESHANGMGSNAINVNDVYHYLKDKLPFNELRQLFLDRGIVYKRISEDPILSENKKVNFINNGCIDTTTLTTFMFKNYGNETVSK